MIERELDRNGYAPSLISKYGFDDTRQCYLCGRRNGKIDRHEIFFGKNRTNSKRYGMWCDLCHGCHMRLHNDNELDSMLKEVGQRTFERLNSREEFMQIFGRNYL